MAQKQVLEQKNAALQEVLEQIGNVKLQIKEDVMRNVDQLLLPIVQKIRRRARRSMTALAASCCLIAAANSSPWCIPIMRLLTPQSSTKRR